MPRPARLAFAIVVLTARSLAAAEPAPVPPPPAWPGYNVPVAQPPPQPPAQRALVDETPFASDGRPLAGYHNGLFYLRDHHDNFHLYIQGRLQLDWFSYLGAGVPETSLKPTLFIRRIRPEITGEFLGHWRFMIAGDFGATAIDNPAGRSVETTAVAPGTAPTAASARYAAAETTRFQAQATDAFVNYRAAPVFNVMVGQMDAPFTMENRTSDKYLPFMERSLAVRAVGIPTNKEIGGMFWGEPESRLFYWSIGPYMGDGQNRPNVDSRFDGFARAFFHPLATLRPRGEPLRDLQIGGSVHLGSRENRWVTYDYPNMSTQGAYSFWSPIYTGSKGVEHIIPSGSQLGVAGELRVPIDRFDLTSEVVYIDNRTREALEGYQGTGTSDRFGELRGVSYYAMAGVWVLGQRDVNGVPGYGNPPRLDWSKSDPVVPDQALQVLAKWEQVSLHYRSASRGGAADPKGIDGDIKVNALSFGANYWATRHVRLSLNYIVDVFPGSAPVTPTEPGGPVQTSRNRAAAPGSTLAPGLDDRARDSARSLNEILARVAIAL